MFVFMDNINVMHGDGDGPSTACTYSLRLSPIDSNSSSNWWILRGQKATGENCNILNIPSSKTRIILNYGAYVCTMIPSIRQMWRLPLHSGTSARRRLSSYDMRRVRDNVSVRGINLMDRLSTSVSTMATNFDCLRTQFISWLMTIWEMCCRDEPSRLQIKSLMWHSYCVYKTEI